MARRNRDEHDKLSQGLERVKRRFDRTPLSCVVSKLQEYVQDVQEALRAKQIAQEQANRLADYLEGIVARLPQTFGDRFRFDAAMIAALTEEWNSGETQLSGMILPRPAAEWGHQSVPIPSYSTQAVPVIDLILVPGDDDLDDIDLLTYPFLGHELGHNALFKHDDAFSAAFETQLQQYLNVLLRQSLADRGTAKLKAKDIIDQTRKVWSPTPNHFNWAHEIAVDLIALWTFGPAYLASFDDVLDDPQLDPYQVGQSHPPYDVRVRALIDAAKELGWSAQSHTLATATQQWPRSDWNRGKDNQYAALAAPSLIATCVDVALRGCQTLRLPQCTPESVHRLQDKLNCGGAPDLGSELILAAWLVRDRSGEPAYAAWEHRVIRTHLEDIML